MSAVHTLNAVKQFCLANSGDEQTWINNDTTYHWNRGKDTDSGLINGVIRKVAGIDATGRKIWAVAGSCKIAVDGSILRFTGMPKKTQLLLIAIARPVAVEYSVESA